MQLKTILNRVQKIKSFVYGAVRWVEGEEEPTIEIEVRGRANSRAECSGCGRRGPGYDTLPERRFEFIPFWGLKVFFLYAPRRVDCPVCGVKVERMPTHGFLQDGPNDLAGKRLPKLFAPPGIMCFIQWRWQCSGGANIWT